MHALSDVVEGGVPEEGNSSRVAATDKMTSERAEDGKGRVCVST